MKDIAEKENSLFVKWERNRQGFVRDGAVDPLAFGQSEPRIVLILKEVNSPGSGNWDLRKFIREGSQARTWENVTRWVSGIRNLPDDLSWSNLKSITESQRCDVLQSICAMNLKKSPGGHTTNNDELARIAEEDRDYINEQFNLYDPDLVICCGSITSWSFWENIRIEPRPQVLWTTRGVPYRKFDKRKCVVEYLHPEARVPDYIKHYSLMDALREILHGQSPGTAPPALD